MPKRRVLALTIALLALTAGCSGGAQMSGGSGGGDSAVSAEMTQTAAQGGATQADSGGSGDAGGRPQVDLTRRQLIYTGEIRLDVRDFERSQRNLTRAVQRRGGYVSDSNVRIHGSENATWKSGRLVLRVPQDNFSAMFERAKAEGRVVEASTSSEDVTEQVVDLQARLKNLRAERDRLRELYEQANDTEDVLAVEERLSDVQEEIERTEARLQAIQRQVAYSTITVEMSEPRPDRPFDAPEQWYDVPLVQAFLDSIHGVVVVARAAAVTAAYALPYLLAFGAPLAVVGELLRRRRGRSADELDSPPDATEAGDTDDETEGGDTDDATEAGDTDDETEGGDTDDATEAGDTDDETEGGDTDDETEGGDTDDETEGGDTDDATDGTEPVAEPDRSGSDEDRTEE